MYLIRRASQWAIALGLLICFCLNIGWLLPALGRVHGVASGAGSRPSTAVLERTEWDFGVVACGPALRATFPVTNAGGTRLILREQSRSCDCVAGSGAPIIVEPGASVELSATLDTHRLNGEVQVEIHYSTSDAQRPRFTLKLLADVQPLSASSFRSPPPR